MKRGGPLARRTPLKAAAGLARTGRLRPVSAKRAQVNAGRRVMVAERWPVRPLCDVREARATVGLPPLAGCTVWADDVNEILRRSQGGSITDPDNTNAPCRYCHGVLTFTPRSGLAWAFALGLVRESRNRGMS